MDFHCLPLPHTKTFCPDSIPVKLRSSRYSNNLSSVFTLSKKYFNRRPPLLTVSASSGGASHCEFSSLNSPLEPRTPVGKFLCGVLQNHAQLFNVTMEDELKCLADDRRTAFGHALLAGSGSDEACLHRRIAQLKEQECQAAIEDVMYMLIFSNFSKIKVALVPKLSRCMYNGRLEICSKDWELESIYSFEVLEIVREHVSSVTGLRVDSSVKENWAMTKIKQALLGRIYESSILYGYFLKSASVRHHLEHSFALANQDRHVSHPSSSAFPCGLNNLLFGRLSNMQSLPHSNESSKSSREMKHEKLKCYVMGFDYETLQRCSKMRSKEAMTLMENHTRALFGDNGETGCYLENDDVIVTSFSTLKRLILEAVAFGYFLWDAEEYVDSLYKLMEN